MSVIGSKEEKLINALAVYISSQKQASKTLEKLISAVSQAKRYDILAEQHSSNGGTTVIHAAATRGEHELVTSILSSLEVAERCRLLEIGDNKGSTALLHAARCGHAQIVQYMLNSIYSERKFEFLSAQNNDNETAIILAAEAGLTQIIRGISDKVEEEELVTLLKMQDKQGQTAIHKAAWFGHTSVLAIISSTVTREHWTELLMLQDTNGNTAILEAVSETQTEVVTKLLSSIDASAKLNMLQMKNKDGKTVLHRAVFTPDTGPLVTILNTLPDDVKLQFLLESDSTFGDTVINLAVFNGNHEAVKFILNAVRSNLQIMLATPNSIGQTPLHIAACKGYTEILDTILSSIAEGEHHKFLKEADNNTATPLCLAAGAGHASTVEKILSFLYINERLDLIKTNSHTSAFHIAAKKGHMKVMECFFYLTAVDHKDKLLFLKDDNYENALSVAASVGNVEMVSYLLEVAHSNKRYGMLSMANMHGQTALHRAALGGHTTVVTAILNSISDEERFYLFQEKDCEGNIAISLAATNGHADTVQYLLENTNTVMMQDLLSLQNKKGFTVLHCSAENTKPDSIKAIFSSLTQQQIDNLLIIKDNQGDTVLTLACHLRHVDNMQYLLTSASNILSQLLQIRNERDETVLHYFSWSGDDDMLRQALEPLSRDCRYELLMVEDKDGDTALAIAISKRHVGMATYILQAVPTDKIYLLLSASNDNGRTPFHSAVYGGLKELVTLALDSVSDANRQDLLSLKDNEDNSILCESLVGGHSETVQCIMNAIPNENHISALATVSKHRKTGFHLAAAQGHSAAIEAALKFVENDQIQSLLELKDESGITPIYEAASNGNTDTLKFLFQQFPSGSADRILGPRNNTGSTALHAAAQSGYLNDVIGGLDMLTEEDKEKLLAAKDHGGSTPREIADQRQSASFVPPDGDESISDNEEGAKKPMMHAYQNIDINNLSTSTANLRGAMAQVNISPFEGHPNVIDSDKEIKKEREDLAWESKPTNLFDNQLQESNSEWKPDFGSKIDKDKESDTLPSDKTINCKAKKPKARTHLYTKAKLGDRDPDYATLVTRIRHDVINNTSEMKQSSDKLEISSAFEPAELTEREKTYLKRILELESKSVTTELVHGDSSANENIIKNMVEDLHQDTITGIYMNLKRPDDKHTYAKLQPDDIKCLFRNVKSTIAPTSSPEINLQFPGLKIDELTLREQALLMRVFELEDQVEIKGTRGAGDSGYLTTHRYDGNPPPPNNMKSLSFIPGEAVKIHSTEGTFHIPGWTYGISKDGRGYFPTAFVSAAASIPRRRSHKMKDWMYYFNEEMKTKDRSTLETYEALEQNLDGLIAGTKLKDYGHLVKEENLLVELPEEETSVNRHVFLFDTTALICSTESQFTCLLTLPLIEYKIADTLLEEKLTLTNKKDSTTLQLCAEDEETAKSWMNAIKLAKRNLLPEFSNAEGFEFKMTTLPENSKCDACDTLLPGLLCQGYLCAKTGKKAHMLCIERIVKRGARCGRYMAADSYVGVPAPSPGRAALNFTEGDIIDVDDTSNPDWWHGSKKGVKGYFPSSQVIADAVPALPARLYRGQSKTEGMDLADYSWYVGEGNRRETDAMLMSQRDGVFLVRESKDNPGTYAIGVSENGTGHQFKIACQDSQYSIGDIEFFSSIPALVEYYNTHTLAACFDELTTCLLIPYKEKDSTSQHASRNPFTDSSRQATVMGVASVLYEYMPLDSNQIQLRQNETVVVVSKVAETKGWWKGAVVRNGELGKIGRFPMTCVKELGGDAMNYL